MIKFSEIHGRAVAGFSANLECRYRSGPPQEPATAFAQLQSRPQGKNVFHQLARWVGQSVSRYLALSKMWAMTVELLNAEP
jgi:hypothetical protein